MACDVFDGVDESGAANGLELIAVVIDVVHKEEGVREVVEQFDNCVDDDVDTEVATVDVVEVVDVIENGDDKISPATLLRINMIGRGDDGELEMIRCLTGDINGGLTIFVYAIAAYLGVPKALAVTGLVAVIVSACW